MAKKIYIGNMLQEVQTSMAALQTDMGTMSTDMANVVAELINVKAAIATSVSTISVKPGSVKEVVLNTAVKTAASTTPVPIMTFKSLCQGSILMTAEIKSGGSGLLCTVGYSINGGSNINISGLTNSSTTYELKSGVIVVSAGDTITINMYCPTNAGTMYMNVGAKVGYEITDIVNGEAIFVG